MPYSLEVVDKLMALTMTYSWNDSTVFHITAKCNSNIQNNLLNTAHTHLKKVNTIMIFSKNCLLINGKWLTGSSSKRKNQQHKQVTT